MSKTSSWPPHYTVRKSKRAKNICLKISRRGHIEVVLPYRCLDHEAEAMVQAKRLWLERQLKRVQAECHQDEPLLPSTIELLAVEQTWSIHYQQQLGKTGLTVSPNEQLIVYGDINQQEKCYAVLKSWLRQQARIILSPWLTELSVESGLTYTRLSIRSQTTRWGSCSAKKNINLNDKLLFLPSALVEHIMLHELCHTVCLNHSQKFWHLLSEVDQKSALHNCQLRKAQRYVPHWLES
ncbi:MAG: M48 family metallopeptidase [Gammaproteobacteria bacterium]|nr:M48 family metallopeptidase [Gammaproteobacteria bacterium]